MCAGPDPPRAAPLPGAAGAGKWGSRGRAPQAAGARLPAGACQRGGRCRSCGTGRAGRQGHLGQRRHRVMGSRVAATAVSALHLPAEQVVAGCGQWLSEELVAQRACEVVWHCRVDASRPHLGASCGVRLLALGRHGRVAAAGAAAAVPVGRSCTGRCSSVLSQGLLADTAVFQTAKQGLPHKRVWTDPSGGSLDSVGFELLQQGQEVAPRADTLVAKVAHVVPRGPSQS